MILSIIIPVYNTEYYLNQCIDSCLNQDASKNDYEIICIDDGSTDSSQEILDKYLRKYSNLRVYKQPNKGVSAARNQGIFLAKGDWLWFVDSDDYIAENSVSELLKTVSLAENKSKKEIEFKVGVFSNGDMGKINVKRLQNYVFSKLYSRKIIIDNNIRFFEKIYYSEDEMFNFIYKNYTEKNALLSNSVFYFYRIQREGSAMWQMDFVKRFASFKWICLWLKTGVAQNVFNDQKRLQLYFYYINTLLNELLKQKFLISKLKQLKKSGLLCIKMDNITTEKCCYVFFKKKKENFVFSFKKFFKKRLLEISRFIISHIFLRKREVIK